MSLFNFTNRNTQLALAGTVLALAGGVLGAGCGGGDTSTVPGFCAALAAQDCSFAVVQACYGSSEATLEADVQNCIRVRSATSKCNPAGLGFHPEYAELCLQAHAAAYSTSSIDSLTFASMNDACLSVFNNGGGEGATCQKDADCDYGIGLRCLVRVGGTGSCRLPVPGNGGDSCKDPSIQCAAGYYCDAGFHCVATPAKGEACGAGQPCAAGYYCSSQVCIDQLANTKSCHTANECLGGFCLGGDGTSGNGQCSANYVFAFQASTCSDFTGD